MGFHHDALLDICSNFIGNSFGIILIKWMEKKTEKERKKVKKKVDRERRY